MTYCPHCGGQTWTDGEGCQDCLLDTAQRQEAWGKWNTAPAWNRYHAAKGGGGGPLVDAAALLAGWVLLAASVVGLIRALVGG